MYHITTFNLKSTSTEHLKINDAGVMSFYKVEDFSIDSISKVPPQLTRIPFENIEELKLSGRTEFTFTETTTVKINLVPTGI